MLGRTRKPHIRKDFQETEKTRNYVTAEEWHKETFGDFPDWAIALAGYRYREDLTQKQLADLIGTSQADISKMERGLRPIGKNIAKRLAKVFDVSYRIFL